MSFVDGFIVVLTVIAFFALSAYAVVFFLMTPWEKARHLHWTTRLVWYWGISFIIFLLASVLLSFVGFIALKLYGG